jgi:hypothetical protein
MTPQQTIYAALYNYPSLFSNKAEVMQHMFCVIGNGYQWEDGELVAYSEELVSPYRSYFESFQRHNNQNLYVEFCTEAKYVHYNIFKLSHELNNELFIIACANDEANLYPLSYDYAKLWNIPENITPEWKQLWQQAWNLFIPMYQTLDTWKPEFNQLRVQHQHA